MFSNNFKLTNNMNVISKLSFFFYTLSLTFLSLLPGCKKEDRLPIVETKEILATTSTSVYLSGEVACIESSGIIKRGFVGGNIPDPSLQSYSYITEEGTGCGGFESTISNITPGIKYFKAYAVNEAGIGYGEEKTINTIEESLYYEFIMEQSDYEFLVEIDPIRPAGTLYENFGFYFGASSYYQKFDFRLQGRRLNKDNDDNYFDPELGNIFENHGTDAAITEMYNRLLYNGLIEILRQRYPNARPEQSSFEIEYVIGFEIFYDNFITLNHFATYKCTKSGSPPNFELSEWDPEESR